MKTMTITLDPNRTLTARENGVVSTDTRHDDGTFLITSQVHNAEGIFAALADDRYTDREAGPTVSITKYANGNIELRASSFNVTNVAELDAVIAQLQIARDTFAAEKGV